MGKLQEGSAGTVSSQEERTALLGNSMVSEMELGESGGEDADPIQQLLAALGEFQRTLQDAFAGDNDGLWCDSCMNQLILGVEIALVQEWAEVMEAFTDAGRILQSYENAGRPEDALPFLDDSYEMLCQLVGEQMTGTVKPEMLERWQRRYQDEVGILDRENVALASDSEEEEISDSNTSGDRGEVVPFEFPDLENKSSESWGGDDELPTLDELPPLESMVPMNGGKKPVEEAPSGSAPNSLAPADELESSIEPKEPVEAENKGDSDALGSPLDPLPEEVEQVTSSASPEAAAPEEPKPEPEAPTLVEPSRVVVEIVDRLCDELVRLSELSVDDRALSFETIQGGITALKREAQKDGFEVSLGLCDLMMSSANTIAAATGDFDDRFPDMGFGFCGVYVESMNDPNSDNITEWREECTGLIEEWEKQQSESTPKQPSPAAQETAAQNSTTVPASEQAAAQEPVAESVQELEDISLESDSEEPVAVAEQPSNAKAEADAPSDSQTMENQPSQALFMQAQEALMRGDGEAAKTLALKAAAMIAEAEVKKAETSLQAFELRLKSSLSATGEARSAVKESEKHVKNASSQVSGGEKSLGEAKEHTAEMAQDLENAQNEVAEIEEQIAEMQTRRENQVEHVDGVQGRLNEAKGNESQVGEHLEGLRTAEQESRKNLESSRQQVKDNQRETTEVEGEMEQAREMLTRQKISSQDIRQTLGSPSASEDSDEQSPDSMLF